MNELLVTAGRKIYPSMRVPLVFLTDKPVGNIENRFRIVLIKKGSGIVTINGVQIILIPPMVMLLNDKDFIQIDTKDKFEAIETIFHPDVINSEFELEKVYEKSSSFSMSAIMDWYLVKVFFKLSEKERIFTVDNDTRDIIFNYMNLVNEELQAQRDKMWPCTARGFFIQLLFFFQRYLQGDNERRLVVIESLSKKKEIKQVITYLLKNYSKKVTIDDLTKEFNTNRTSLSSHFKKEMGKSIMSYLKDLRIQIAASLMHNTALDVSEIIEDVGITDLAYFGKLFKETFGLAPTMYRKKYKKMLY